MALVPTFRQIGREFEPATGVVILVYEGAGDIECSASARRLATDEWVENAPLSVNEAVEWSRDRAMMFDFDEILIKLDRPGLWQADWGPLA